MITNLRPTERRLLLDALVEKGWNCRRLEEIGYDPVEVGDAKMAYERREQTRWFLTGKAPAIRERTVSLDDGADHPMESSEWRRRNDGSVTFAGWYPGKQS